MYPFAPFSDSLLGPDVSPSSGPQLAAWLTPRIDADTLKRWPKTAKKQQLKTDADSLALFAHLPIVQPLLRYKAVSKLLSIYSASYPKQRHPVTDCLHPLRRRSPYKTPWLYA